MAVPDDETQVASLTPAQMDEMAHFVAGTWSASAPYDELPGVAEALGTATRTEGLSVHLRVLRRLQGRLGHVAGYKIGSTSRSARDSMGPRFRPFGGLLEHRMFRSGVTLLPGDVVAGHVEPELCLTLGSPLYGPDVTPEQARAAVSGVAPAFEIISRRVLGAAGDAQLLADGLHHWGVIRGTTVAPPPDLGSVDMALWQDDALIGTSTTGPDVLDDPFLSLARVCATLHCFGLGLEAGHQVITGSVLAPIPLPRSEPIRADFGPLGEVVVRFR